MILALFLLVGLVLLAGADDFRTGFLASYGICKVNLRTKGDKVLFGGSATLKIEGYYYSK